LWAAWHYGGADPYRLYNMLDEAYRPIGQPDAEPRPPRFPDRLQRFMYGLAKASAVIDGKVKDEPYVEAAGPPRPQRRRLTEQEKLATVYGPRGEVLSRRPMVAL
jgi:hypothetical protein